MKPEDKLPSEGELGLMLGVSRYTIREALAILSEENVVYKVQGKGTFIKKFPLVIESGLEKLESITEIIRKVEQGHKVKCISVEAETPTTDIKNKLNLKEGEKVLTFTRVMYIGEKAAVYCVDSMPCDVVNWEAEDKRYEGESIFKYLQEKFNIHIEYAVSYIIPTLPTKEMVEDLKLNDNDLFTLLNQIHYDQNGRPLIYSMDYFNADVFKFKVNRMR